MDKVVAIVVTYNRHELLIKCLDAILSQTYSVSKLLVVNNRSTDGTEKLFQEGGKYYGNSVIECLNLDKNIGGAGGFSTGIKYTDEKSDYDWVWVMDDDVIPQEDSLQELINAKELLTKKDKKIGFLASEVYGLKGEFMNVPAVDTRATENGYANWFEHLEDGIVSISNATFVSLLIPRKAIRAVGYPIADYFIWGDDSEYTTRITTNYATAYFVGRSKVLHARQTGKSISIRNADSPQRIKMYHYFYRNSLLNKRKYGSKKQVLMQIIKNEKESFSLLFKASNYKITRFNTIQKGIFEFMFKSRGLK